MSGTLSEEQIDDILKTLDAGEYFIPEQVGLPCERFADTTEDDHPYCEMDRSSFTTTIKNPTVDLGAEELYNNFMSVKEWQDWKYIHFL